MHRIPWLVAALMVLPLLLMGCGGAAETSGSIYPATVEPIDGTETSSIVLTAKAAERLDIQTAQVRAAKGSHTVIPYSAVFYEPTGETWAYVSPEPLTFIRHSIVIDSIAGNRAVLSQGPAIGTKVATVGVAELFGAESGIGQPK